MSAGEENTDKAAQMSRNLHSTIHTSEMPRERALKYGLRSLTNAEIIAILLGSGIRGKNVLDIANELAMSNEGHLSMLMNMMPHDISRDFDGIGDSKALTLLAAMELGRRAADDAAQIQLNSKPLTSSQALYKVMQNRFLGLDHEEFWVLALNNRLCRIVDFCVGEGNATGTIVDVRKVVLRLLGCGACAVALFHNHPSGATRPSTQDEAITRKIADAAKLLDIRMIDHLIMTDSGYYSFFDQGKL